MHNTNWKYHIFTRSRPVTLSKLKSDRWKYPDAQVHTLNIISMKFQVCSINGLRNTPDTNCKFHIFTKSRPTAPSMLNLDGWKYPGAHVHTLNISLKFQVCSIKGFRDARNTNWKTHFFTKSRSITPSMLKLDGRNTQVHKFRYWTIYPWSFKSEVQTVSEMRATQTENPIFSQSQDPLLHQCWNRMDKNNQVHKFTSRAMYSKSFKYVVQPVSEIHTTQTVQDGQTDGCTDGHTNKGKSICPPPPL